MHGILVFFVVAIPLVFHPAAYQPVQPECPPISYDLEVIRSIAASGCWYPQETAAGERGRAGSGEEIPEFERMIDRPPVQERYHVVRRGESLSKIARRYDTGVGVLLLANPQVRNPNLIHVGDRLRIPSAAETGRLRTEAEQRMIEYQRQVAANVPHNGERWIDVNLQTQTVRAYEGNTLVNTFIASTGRARTPTVTGQFRIWTKLRTDDMRGPGYDLKDVPYVMYFHKGYGLHGTYWHNNFGTPMSSGCVNLRTEDAAWLFEFSSVGTLVNVH